MRRSLELNPAELELLARRWREAGRDLDPLEARLRSAPVAGFSDGVRPAALTALAAVADLAREGAARSDACAAAVSACLALVVAADEGAADALARLAARR